MKGFTLDEYCCKIYPDSDLDSLVTYCVAKSRFVLLGSDRFLRHLQVSAVCYPNFQGLWFSLLDWHWGLIYDLLSSLSSNLFYPITEDYDLHAISHDFVKL